MSPIREITIIISSLSALPALWIGRRQRHLLWWYCGLSFGADVVGYLLRYFDVSIGAVVNVFLLGEWLLISTYLIRFLRPPAHRQKWYRAIGVIAVGFTAWALWEGFGISCYSGSGVLYSMYVSLLMACLYKIMRDLEYIQLEKSPFFIFCAVFLIFTAGCMTLMGVHNYLKIHNQPLLTKLWVIQNGLNMFKNGSLAYCIYLFSKPKK